MNKGSLNGSDKSGSTRTSGVNRSFSLLISHPRSAEVVSDGGSAERPPEIEEPLEAVQKAFLAVTGYAPVGIALLQHRRFRYVNPAAAELFGYRAEEMIDRMDIRNVLCRQDWERAGLRLADCEDRPQGDIQLKVQAMKKDGERFMLELRGRTVSYSGESAVLCYLLDVTREHELTGQLVQAREAEQRRLGEELHDGVASRLTGISMVLKRHVEELRQGGNLTEQQLRELHGKLDEGIKQLRRLSHGLNPTGFGGTKLPRALGELASSIAAGFEGRCIFEEAGDSQDLEEDEAVQLYRIAQEAATNAARHSQASRVRIKLQWEADGLLIEVDDDGVGFQPEDETEGIGLTSMSHRARRIGAELHLDTAIGEGTTVRCRLPAVSR